MRAVTPDPVHALNAVRKVMLVQGGEGSVDGDPIQAFIEVLNIGWRERNARLAQEIEDLLPVGGQSEFFGGLFHFHNCNLVAFDEAVNARRSGVQKKRAFHSAHDPLFLRLQMGRLQPRIAISGGQRDSDSGL